MGQRTLLPVDEPSSVPETELRMVPPEGLEDRRQSLDEEHGPWVVGAPVRGASWNDVLRFVYMGCVETFGEANALREAYWKAQRVRRQMAWAAYAAGRRAYDTEHDPRLALQREPYTAAGPVAIFRVGRGDLVDAQRSSRCHFCNASCTLSIYADGYVLINPHAWLQRGVTMDELCPYALMEYPRRCRSLEWYA